MKLQFSAWLCSSALSCMTGLQNGAALFCFFCNFLGAAHEMEIFFVTSCFMNASLGTWLLEYMFFFFKPRVPWQGFLVAREVYTCVCCATNPLKSVNEPSDTCTLRKTKQRRGSFASVTTQGRASSLIRGINQVCWLFQAVKQRMIGLPKGSSCLI